MRVLTFGKRNGVTNSPGHCDPKYQPCRRYLVLEQHWGTHLGGSGCAIIAAETTGGVFLAMEIMPGYCDVALLHWQAFTGEPAILDGEDRAFDDVAAMRMASNAATAAGQSASAA